MIFWIIISAICLAPVMIGIVDAFERSRKPDTSKKQIIKEFFNSVWFMFILTGLGGAVLITVIGLVGSTIPGSKQITVSQEVYQIAPGSKIEYYDGEFEFIAAKSDGTLEYKSIFTKKVTTLNADATEVVVQRDDHYHEVFFPWPFSTKNTVIVK